MTQERTSDSLPIIVSAKTGLIPKGDAVMRILPSNYSGKTVKEALDFLLNSSNLKTEEKTVAKSVSHEMKEDNYVVVINGRNAELENKIGTYLVEKEHEAQDGRKMKYNALEIEVSAVQEGGIYSRLV